MDRIDIAMTAVLRPKILRKTLSTIVKNVVDDQERFRLIINIDPVGEKVDPMDLVDIAKGYFDDVIYNIPDSPSFPLAVKWAWSNATAPYVFHWEDDIVILRKINVDKMIRIHKKHPEIASLRLYFKPTTKKKLLHTFRSRWHYNEDGFYLARGWKDQFGLNVNFLKQEFVSEAASLLRGDLNPEKQFRHDRAFMRPLIKKWKYALYTSPGQPALISGKQGTKWRQNMGFTKPPGAKFLKWTGKGAKARKVSRETNMIRDKYPKLWKVAMKFDNTSSILDPVNKSLTFARNDKYLEKLLKQDKKLHVIVPHNINRKLANQLPPNITTQILNKEDNIEYIFTYLHNKINKNKKPKPNIISPSAKIHKTAVIGVHGNTYCRDPEGNMVNLKHMGNVVIGDNVDVEALSIVHRAGMASTIIGKGTKVCVKCNIGHNCVIGKRTFIAPGVLLGGGTKVGNNCYIWQGVITRSNISICDNVVIGAGSLVMHDITKPGVYFGSPAKYVKPYDESLR
jgi:UDP-3-O-[3-hydroxymyristoyl] glucosamine N-acyltransferase